jgi:hypothetical protein
MTTSSRILVLAGFLVLATSAQTAFAVCGDGVVDGGEQCDLAGANGAPSSCCTTLCEFRTEHAICRPAVASCDVTETCSGTSGDCPIDGLEPLGLECRASAGACDPEEECDGIGPTCPDDLLAPAGTLCRDDAGPCDVEETCSGSDTSCPADVVEASGTTCRVAVGPCDIAETCDGSATACPSDSLQPSGAICRGAASPCDVAETCSGSTTDCPADGFQPNDSPCNDGSACTEGDHCFQGVCIGTQNLDACLDDFLCYKARAARATPFGVIPNVSLSDQFQDSTVFVVRPRQLCTPADKNGEGTVDPATHLETYLIRNMPGSTRHSRRTNVLVENQIGQIRVDTKRPDSLMVPTAKDLTIQPPAPDPLANAVDHYECYTVRVTPGTPRFPAAGVFVTVTDQFLAQPKTLRLKRPRRLCNPVDKNGEGIKNPTAHLMCYAVSPVPPPVGRRGLFVTNQFVAGQVDTKHEQDICIPSTKTTPP